MKTAVAFSLIAGAAAFAPASKQASSTSLAASFEDEIGVIAPTGFFDPLELTKNADAERFAQFRNAELKHGRVSMLAVVGYVTQEVFRFPGEIAPGLKFADVPNGLDAINAIPSLGWAQIFFLIGSVDYYGFLGNFEVGKPDLDGPTSAKRQLQELQ